ncbi:glutamate receptor ionotropic, kainate 2-like isoform X1 [Scylla paramamosain]|uniref:glutamate receptor ionotropic, kainate 2-like isoform X1 n=2 Tax=Scylla paramamosain TaxID=85552 RepID=UPI003083A78E
MREEEKLFYYLTQSVFIKRTFPQFKDRFLDLPLHTARLFSSMKRQREESEWDSPVSSPEAPLAMLRRVSLLVVLLAFTGRAAASDVIKIGGLFNSQNEYEVIFKYAVDTVNRDRSLLPHTLLATHEEFVQPDDSFNSSRKACLLLQYGVAAIFGPQSGQSAAHVQSICDAFEVPHLEYRWDFGLTTHAYSVNLYPSPSTLSKAYIDVLETLQWRKFFVIYENNESLARVQEVVKSEMWDVILRQLPVQDYRPFLNGIRAAGVTRVVLDVGRDKIHPFLQQAQDLGMTASGYHYFITSLDLHTVELMDFRQGATFTGLSLMDPSSPLMQRITHDLESDSLRPDHVSLTPLKTEAALIYDAVHFFAKAVDDLSRSIRLYEVSLDCAGDSTWEHGTALLNYINLAEVSGLTGLIKLDEDGSRRDVTLHIIEFTREGLNHVGKWDPANGASYTGTHTEEKQQDKTLVITSVLSPPYVMLRKGSEQLTGNERYEGFCVDLIHKVSEIIGFNYTIKAADDGLYGNLDETTGKWRGMIGELVNQKADLAIGDLTVTYEREKVVDFTMPWMNLGISILYQKAIRKPPSLFAFLSPFSADVWLIVITAYLGISLLLFVMARCHVWAAARRQSRRGSPSRLTEGGESDASKSGAEMHERSVSTHILNGLWWFFTLVMVSLYASNVGGALTVQRVELPIESVQDLALQTKIKYGTIYGGSTWQFFKSSKIPTYQRMFAFMESQRPTVYTNSYEEGVRRVQASGGQYAYMLETSTIEYITDRHCDLRQVGGLIDSKSYGFALSPGSSHTKAISQAILNLREEGVLEALKSRWWKQKRGGGKCAHSTEDSEGSDKAIELGLENVGGVFVVLVVGMSLALMVAVCEFAWKSRAQGAK